MEATISSSNSGSAGGNGDEEQRRAAEIAQLQKDEKNKEMEARACENLVESIELIPEVDKKAYLKAQECCPHLVETESNPLCFLRFDNYNCWDSAGKIVSYWEERRKAFGETLFVRPLSLNRDESAFSTEAIDAILGNIAFLLPQPDVGGRPVIYSNQSLYRKLSIAARVQIGFYFTALLMQNPILQTEGIVAILAMETVNFNRGTKLFLQALRNAIPIRLHSVHILCKKNQDSIKDGIVPVILNLYKFRTKNRTYVHLYKSKKETAEKLLPYGILKESLATYLGGTWELEGGCSSSTSSSGSSGGASAAGSRGNPLVDPLVASSSAQKHVDNADSKPSPSRAPVTRKRSSSNISEVAAGSNAAPMVIASSNISNPSAIAAAASTGKIKEDRTEKAFSNIDSGGSSEDGTIWEEQSNINNNVLLGRGQRYLHNPGNVRLLALIAKNLGRYERAKSKKDIKNLKEEIMGVIHNEGGRFLEIDPSTREWTEVCTSYALQKIGQSFRNYQVRKKKKQQSTLKKTP